VVRQSGLGKGLGALIPGPEESGTPPGKPASVPSGGGVVDGVGPANQGDGVSGLLEIPISSIVPNRFQTREAFDEAALDDLAASIKEVGVLQPILVRPQSGGSYELVAGERRWRAARRAGLTSIPALVRDTTDQASVVQVLVENLQREDLDALEEAAGFQQMINELQLTHDEIATKLGRSRSSVTNGLRLLQLSPAIQKLIKTRELSAGHARALLAIPDKASQDALARKAVSEGLTVRALEAAVQLRSDLAAGKSGKPTKPSGSATSAGETNSTATAPKPAALLELEEILSDQLNTRVSIDLGTKHGKIVIEFADLEDLERVFLAMTPAGGIEPYDTPQ
jgi:ParB family transcriptional regulator, chromosome partitioning protein